MADINIFETVAGSGAIDLFLYVVLGLLIAGVLGVLIYMVWLLIQYKIEVEITDTTSAGRVIYKDKARIFRGKDGRLGWQLMKTKGAKRKRKIIDEVPNMYIDLTVKGKKFVRLKKLEGDIFSPWHPTVQEQSDEEIKKQSLPTSDRETLINEIYRSEKLYGKKSLGEIILHFMPYVILLMMIFGIVVLVDQVGETYNMLNGQLNEARKLQNEHDAMYKETVDRMINFIEGKQVITKETVPD